MEIRHLCFAYGNNPVIKDLSFTIEEGKITTILGPNGCGKTTLFNLLTRNLYPIKGISPYRRFSATNSCRR